MFQGKFSLIHGDLLAADHTLGDAPPKCGSVTNSEHALQFNLHMAGFLSKIALVGSLVEAMSRIDANGVLIADCRPQRSPCDAACPNKFKRL